ncbi:ImmA/IrrE family metallo-endopeptidase [Enterococcus sp. DIV2163]|uniref:ImmA/IrrE family metallo-endopeptidase n=1 Tax=Enterococcus sp. DIV2163 TaxID=2774834 RepID=UPI003D2FF5ED
MPKKIFYKDIYEPNFLDKFGENSRAIGNLELSEENGFFIDVYKIAEILNITVNQECISDDSGEYDSVNRIITVNEFEPECRQRFTIAHELGHAVLGHPGVSLRTTMLEKYQDVVKKGHEVMANKFAAELLMPRNLILQTMNELIAEKNWDSKSLDNDQVDELISLTAKKLKVSEISMNYSVKNNNIFVDGDY